MRPPELVVKVNITKTILPSSDKTTKKNMLKQIRLKQIKQKSVPSINNKDIELDDLNKNNDSNVNFEIIKF